MEMEKEKSKQLKNLEKVFQDKNFTDEMTESLFWLFAKEEKNQSEIAEVIKILGEHRPEVGSKISNLFLSAYIKKFDGARKE